MSDSFADLWNSSAPSQPQKSVPLSQQKPASSSPYTQPKPKHDVFALLSQSSTPAGRSTTSFNNNSSSNLNQGASRPGSSLNVSSPGGSRPLTPSLSNGGSSGISRPGSSLSSVATSSSGNKAFDDLLLGSFGGGSKSSANMTIAERAAMVEKQRLASLGKGGQAAAAQDSNHHQWAGLDALGGGQSMASSASVSNKVVVDDQDDWGLGDFSSATAPTAAPTKPRSSQQRAPQRTDSSLLEFDSFDSSSSTKGSAALAPAMASRSQAKSGSLWDMDDFASESTSAYDTQSTPQAKPKEKFDSPDFDFDFGNREDQGSNANAHAHDEDDILGMLSKPVEAVRAQAITTSSAPSTASRSARPRSSSPPPHVIGQVVEMGFSVQQARSALAQTESGADVQAALEILLGEGDSGSGSAAPPRNARNSPSPPPRRRFVYEDDDDPEFVAMQRRRHQQQQSQRQTPGGANTNAERPSTPNIQDQADKILAQASEIGLSVLSKASLFWKEGKEKVQKVYEERAGGSGQETPDRGFPPTRANGNRDTRPKWMQDVVAHSDDDPTSPKRGAFRDDHDNEGSAFRNSEPISSRQRGAQPSSSGSSPPVRRSAPPQPEVDLFSSAPGAAAGPAEPKAYASPWRRKKTTTDASSSPAPTSSSNGPSRPSPTPSRSPPKPKRRLISCPEMTLDIVRQHKTKGTEGFKLGQFSVAGEEYSKAITMLPAKHMLLVPLYTNRALAKIRCGECKGAVEDATEALTIIGRGADSWKGWNPSEEGGWELDGGSGEASGGYGVAREKGSEWNDSWGRGVDLKDGWVKAVRRRAEAFEGMEKWTEARKDWEVLTGAGWVDGKTREDAVRGIGRCKKMLGGEAGGASGRSGSNGAARAAAPQVKPRPRPTPAPKVVPSGAAVKAYREQVDAAEAEDTLKHQLKDSVEAKLLAWKKGKEANLRALLASLDTVLWEEVIKDMGGKPGLADLVSGGGVKKWYMRSVARVHPDKLNANNSTVEQRMIAGGVFGALNEAWIAFKQ